MRKRSARPVCVDSLQAATMNELVHEIKRRSLGCMVICVRPEEHGDHWHYALKGSPILLGALGAALSLRTNEHLAAQTPGAESTEV
jgi:hypothetical protein